MLQLKAFTSLGRRTPFRIRFLSDNYEFTDAANNADADTKEANNADIGFRLAYIQTAC